MQEEMEEKKREREWPLVLRRDPGEFRILIVDDEEEHAAAMAEALAKVGYRCTTTTRGDEAIEILDGAKIDLVITDLVMAPIDGMELLRAAQEAVPPVEVILVTAHGGAESAVQAMEEGALTYLTKPVNLAELRSVVNRAAERVRLERDNVALQRQLSEKYGFSHIIGNSPRMHFVFDTLRQAADTTATVLILGESGTGKELVARTLHQNSSRRNRPFVALNCAAFSEGILESELFGHEKGAFTGALYTRKGHFENANHGSLFLDEVGDMPMTTQIKLLRFLEEREILRVGSNDPIKVDVRLIAASNKDLDEEVKAGNFRQDLLYRLKVIAIRLPPLRERQGDIPLMIDAFMREYARIHDREIVSISPEARRILSTYHWPGNVRELKNCLESMVVMNKDGYLDTRDIPDYIFSERQEPEGIKALTGMSLEEVEEELIRNTLQLTQGNREEAAKTLGIGERTLYRKIKKYGIK
jgi:two-component system response regulator HydG